MKQPRIKKRITFGIIGCGRWGRNYLRLLNGKPGVQLAFVADTNAVAVSALRAQHENIRFITQDIESVFKQDVDAVIIATPVEHHYSLSKAALLSGKHVLCEKPVAKETREVSQLKKIAEARNLVFLPGHIFVYNKAVTFIKRQLEQAALGEIYYITAQRAGLGPVRNDVDVLYDLAIHDIAILNYILGENPQQVRAIAANCLNLHQNDIAHLFLKYKKNLIASIMVSWLHPSKIRNFCVIGSKKMLLFDDVNNMEKIRLFNKGIDYQPKSGDFGEFQLSVRDGNIYTPVIKYGEPLETELDDFIRSIRTGKQTKVTAQDALDIAKILHAADRSAQHGGNWMSLKY